MEGDGAEPEPDTTLRDARKLYVFLIKWKDCAHAHATWELEQHVQHLQTYTKVKRFKHAFIDRLTVLASERVAQESKDSMLAQ